MIMIIMSMIVMICIDSFFMFPIRHQGLGQLQTPPRIADAQGTDHLAASAVFGGHGLFFEA